MISQSFADRLRAETERAKTALRNIKESSDEVVTEALHTSETVGTAALVGALKGYSGRDAVAGVPLELGIGGLLMLLGGFKLGGEKMSGHLVAAGKGPLASWAGQFGETFGRKMAQQKGTQAAKGELSSGYVVSGDEEAAARRWRENIEAQRLLFLSKTP